jgi:hypothetical protein
VNHFLELDIVISPFETGKILTVVNNLPIFERFWSESVSSQSSENDLSGSSVTCEFRHYSALFPKVLPERAGSLAWP